MKAEHQRWIAESLRLGRERKFEEAYRLASLVICEDEKNIQALWLVANVTRSLHERRWALRALLLIDPHCKNAQDMLRATTQRLESTARHTEVAIRPLSISALPPYIA